MTIQEMERVKRTVIRKYSIFASVALFNVPIEEDNSVKTAAVWVKEDNNGKLVIGGIKYNSDFFDSLSFNQQVFVLAHETFHIVFKHFERSLEKPKKDIDSRYQKYCETVTDENLRKIKLFNLEKKYYNFWNIATDACINAILKNDGLDMPTNVIDKKTGIPMNFVDIADGLDRRAEIIYDSIVKKDNEEEQDKQNNDNQHNHDDNVKKEASGDEIFDNIDDFDIDDYQGIDSHEHWRGNPTDFKDKDDSKIQREDNQDNNKENTNKNEDEISNENEEKNNSFDIDEVSLFKEICKKRDAGEKQSLSEALDNITKGTSLDDVIFVKPVLSWKQLLIGSIEKEEERWGYRRASRYMPNAKLEDKIQDERAITEIILDTSGSISEQLLKQFLCQLVPLFKETEIKVGCFAGKFHGFTELKRIEQIKTFRPIRDNAGTNFEAAVMAFSKDNPSRRINKIVFTDGKLDSIASHIQQTKVDGVIWVVFGDKMNFKPLSGKVIRVSESDLSKITGSITNVNFKFQEENEIADFKRRR